MGHQRRNSLELHTVNIDEAEGSSGNELEEYLIQRNESNNNSSFKGLFGKVTSGVKQFVPKRLGGTGSIEDDIAIRFGMFGSSSGGSSGQSGVSGAGGWLSRCGCGYTMSRKERIIGFFILLGLGILFFTLSGLYLPVLIFKARKFSILFTFGSVFTFASLSLLWGFRAFLAHLFTSERLPFTILYFGSLFTTLYFAIGLQSTILTVIGISVQIVSLLSFLISYLPGGVAGLGYLTKFVSSSFTRTLPI